MAGREALRETLLKRQQKWMREREAEVESRSALGDLETAWHGAQGGNKVPGEGKDNSSAVLNRVTERMLERMRVELHTEVQREQQLRLQAAAPEEHAKMEGFLAREIEGHTCPVCYELMLPPEHSPTLLFPCGHTFCSGCLFKHMELGGKRSCPFCRVTITSKAPNLSMQQLTQTYAAHRARLRGGLPLTAPASSVPDTAAGPGDAAGEGGRIQQELTSKSMRLSVIRNELDDALRDQQAASKQLASASHLRQQLNIQEAGLRNRLDQLKAELLLVRKQSEGQENKVQELQAQADVAASQVRLLSAALTPLEAEVEKLTLLSQGVQEMQQR